MPLTATDKDAIATRVAALERALGIEIVTIVADKCDEYPEVVWKAFAFGAVFTALFVAIADLLRPDWVTSALVFTSLVTVLAVGGACALAAVYVHPFARLFLRRARAAVEVAQYANDRFVARELFATPGRTALLIVVGMLEHRVVVLADKGLHAHATPAQWDAVVARMTDRLATGATGAALLAGLDGVDELLSGKALPHHEGNVFADAPVIDGGTR